MWNDRPAKQPVDVHGDITEMDVQLSVRELRSLLDHDSADSLLSGRYLLEPWVRVTEGAEWTIRTGIAVTPENDEDGA